MNLLYTNSKSKIVYGFHERKIVLYAKFAMHLLLRYIEIYLLDWREPETLFIYDVVPRSLPMSYIRSGGKEADKKKNTYFFCFLLHFITEGFFRIESALISHFFLCSSKISFLWGSFSMLCTCVGFSCSSAWFVFARIIWRTDDA